MAESGSAEGRVGASPSKRILHCAACGGVAAADAPVAACRATAACGVAAVGTAAPAAACVAAAAAAVACVADVAADLLYLAFSATRRWAECQQLLRHASLQDFCFHQMLGAENLK